MTDRPTTQIPSRLARLSPACPTRSLNWRWRRAGLMLDLGLRWVRRRDDGSVREAKRYQSQWRSHPDQAGRARLDARMPEVAGALAIRDGDPSVRRAVEGRLLAGLACESIAAELGLAAGAVERYEQLFFNVADRLGNRGYIVHRAIGTWGRRPGPPDPDSLSRIFGYFGGPIALMALESSPAYASICAGMALGPAIVAGLTPDPVGLTIAALYLGVDPGSRAGPMMLLRIAESERRYRSKAIAAGLFMPVVESGLIERLDQLVTAGSVDAAAGHGEEPGPGQVADIDPGTSCDSVGDRREGGGSTDRCSTVPVLAWDLVA